MASRILAGRYELQEKIGEGGMAVVFKSRDRLLNRYVAIKILRPEFTKDAVFIESFRRESQMAAGLTHPNIVNVFDVGKEGNIYYIVMELMKERALSDIIKEEGALDARRATNITRQIASALSAAHKNRLIHRDVKPHNIMFSYDGVAKITDFGIAKKVTGETLVGDKKENVMGSVHYFSPEQSKGGYVDERSDIYSLGICLYEMLTAKVPFDGETAVEVAVKHMNEAMVPPTQINPSIPLDLEEIILRATDKNPDKRYQSADEMITALSFVSFNNVRHDAVQEKVEDSVESSSVARMETPVKKETHISDDYLIRSEAQTMHSDIPESASYTENKQGHKTSDNAVEAQNDYRPKKKKHSIDERNGVVKEPKKRFWLAPQRYIAVVLAIVLAIPLSAGIYGITHKDPSQQKDNNNTKVVETTVPNIVGKSLQEATAALAKNGLKLEVDLELVSSEVPEGQIMSQTPSADSKIKSNQTVRVNVSKGSVSGSVPNITGKSTKSAQTVLDSYNYKMVVSSYKSDSKIDEGYIISQDPKAGTEMAAGGTVYIVVSSGAGEAVEFDIVGKPYSEARTIIQDAGYSIGVVSNQTSDDVEYGCVIKYVASGKSVDLYISSGIGTGGKKDDETTIETDGYINYIFDYSDSLDTLNQLDAAAFTVNISIIDDAGRRTMHESCVIESGQTVLHIPGSGTDGSITIMSLDIGTTIQLTHVNFTEHSYYVN